MLYDSRECILYPKKEWNVLIRLANKLILFWVRQVIIIQVSYYSLWPEAYNLTELTKLTSSQVYQYNLILTFIVIIRILT